MTILIPARRTLAALLAVVASGGGLFSPAWAETSSTFDVAAEIVPGCRVDGLGANGDAGRIGTLDFGTDSTFSTATHSATTTTNQAIRLRCTPGVNLAISVDGGAHAAAGLRHLQPIAIGGTVAVAVSGANSEDVRLPLYASLSLPGALPPGTYADTLTITLSW